MVAALVCARGEVGERPGTASGTRRPAPVPKARYPESVLDRGCAWTVDRTTVPRRREQ